MVELLPNSMGGSSDVHDLVRAGLRYPERFYLCLRSGFAAARKSGLDINSRSVQCRVLSLLLPMLMQALSKKGQDEVLEADPVALSSSSSASNKTHKRNASAGSAFASTFGDEGLESGDDDDVHHDDDDSTSGGGNCGNGSADNRSKSGISINTTSDGLTALAGLAVDMAPVITAAAAAAGVTGAVAALLTAGMTAGGKVAEFRKKSKAADMRERAAWLKNRDQMKREIEAGLIPLPVWKDRQVLALFAASLILSMTTSAYSLYTNVWVRLMPRAFGPVLDMGIAGAVLVALPLLFRASIPFVIIVLKKTPSTAVSAVYIFRRWTQWNFGFAVASNAVKVFQILLTVKEGCANSSIEGAIRGTVPFAVGTTAVARGVGFVPSSHALQIAPGDGAEGHADCVTASAWPHIILMMIAVAGLFGNIGDLKVANIGKVLPLFMVAAYFVCSSVWAALSGLSLVEAFEVGGQQLVRLDTRSVIISVVNAAGLIGLLGLHALIEGQFKSFKVREVMWWFLDLTLDDLLAVTGEVTDVTRRPHQWLEAVTPSSAACDAIKVVSRWVAVGLGFVMGAGMSAIGFANPLLLAAVYLSCLCVMVYIYLVRDDSSRVSDHCEDRWETLLDDFSPTWRLQYDELRQGTLWKRCVDLLQPRPRFVVRVNNQERSLDATLSVSIKEPWVPMAQAYFIECRASAAAADAPWGNTSPTDAAVAAVAAVASSDGGGSGDGSSNAVRSSSNLVGDGGSGGGGDGNMIGSGSDGNSTEQHGVRGKSDRSCVSSGCGSTARVSDENDGLHNEFGTVAAAGRSDCTGSRSSCCSAGLRGGASNAIHVMKDSFDRARLQWAPGERNKDREEHHAGDPSRFQFDVEIPSLLWATPYDVRVGVIERGKRVEDSLVMRGEVTTGPLFEVVAAADGSEGAHQQLLMVTLKTGKVAYANFEVHFSIGAGWQNMFGAGGGTAPFESDGAATILAQPNTVYSVRIKCKKSKRTTAEKVCRSGGGGPEPAFVKTDLEPAKPLPRFDAEPFSATQISISLVFDAADDGGGSGRAASDLVTCFATVASLWGRTFGATTSMALDAAGKCVLTGLTPATAYAVTVVRLPGGRANTSAERIIETFAAPEPPPPSPSPSPSRSFSPPPSSSPAPDFAPAPAPAPAPTPTSAAVNAPEVSTEGARTNGNAAAVNSASVAGADADGVALADAATGASPSWFEWPSFTLPFARREGFVPVVSMGLSTPLNSPVRTHLGFAELGGDIAAPVIAAATPQAPSHSLNATPTTSAPTLSSPSEPGSGDLGYAATPGLRFVDTGTGRAEGKSRVADLAGWVRAMVPSSTIAGGIPATPLPGVSRRQKTEDPVSPSSPYSPPGSAGVSEAGTPAVMNVGGTSPPSGRGSAFSWQQQGVFLGRLQPLLRISRSEPLGAPLSDRTIGRSET